VAPFSLAKEGESGPLHDLANEECGKPIGGSIVPAFFIDWKDGSDVRAIFGWPTGTSDLRRELRMHNSNDATRRRAMDEHLFAYKLIVPEDRKWTGWVGLQDVPQDDQQKVIEDLYTLLREAALSIGKTETRAAGALVVENSVNPVVASYEELTEDNRWRIVLQSHAILCAPEALYSGVSIVDACTTQFAEFMGGASGINVVNVFARQTLVGDYIANRYQGGKAPFLLFEPGSTFTIEADSAQACEKHIKNWLKNGLPFPKWAEERYGNGKIPGSHWSRCPYIPQNGYGAICSNLELSDMNSQQGGN
jgi:hypothetical protein